jgi:penicillin-binding protein 2
MANARPRWRREKRREPEDNAKALKLRLGLIRLSILALFCLLVIQLWKMQIVSAEYFQTRAEHNRLRPEPGKEPIRGVIYARDGERLVRNIPSFTVFVTPADVPVERTDEIAGYLAKLLDEPKEDILSAIQARRARRQIFDRIPVKVDVDHDVALRIEEWRHELPGVLVKEEQLREYTGGVEVSHIVGYLGRINADEYRDLQQRGYGISDRLGKAGVEATYEADLKGRYGQSWVEVDVTGRPTKTVGEVVQPVAGRSLRLSIDLDLQRKVTEIMQAYMADSKQVVAIAGNPQTGEVYAIVSLPTFDNNIFTRGVSQRDWEALNNDRRYPMLNHAIASNSPPGSIYKVISAAAALQEGVATPTTTITSRGSFNVKNDFDETIQYTFRDTAVGTFNLYDGIARSSNTYFYYLAGGFAEGGFRGLGLDRLVRYSHQFGLGAPTGIDLPGEVAGLVPDEAWKRKNWKEGFLLGDLYNMGIGQGFLLTTPIQMWNANNAIANGGTLYQPRVARDILDEKGEVVVPFTPRVVGKVGVDDAHLNDVRLGMRAAVERGTASNANLMGFTVAAKTGTSEYGVQDPRTGEYANSHAWFMGFAPFEDPTFSVLVFVERGIGSRDATPAAARIFQYYLQERPRRAP